MTHTCQICGRIIKAKLHGLIAHHGYKRPGDGWQTRSCFGAKRVPYEVGHDALDEYAALLADRWLPEADAALAALLASPPAEIIYTPRYAGRPQQPMTLARPEGFDAEKLRRFGCSRFHSYEAAYSDRRRALESRAKAMREDLAFVRERLAAWKAAA